ncbi:MAG: tryptophan--tRNA ligase [Methanobacteriota archaeon]|nr:MAG: tryptophan--tRNA ligase [Euryarchaeota archaeon]
MNVTPWTVEGTIDYSKLMDKFGTKPLTPELLSRLEKLAGSIPPMIRRGFFFSHRDFDAVLKETENGEGFFLYTGRGPSGSMHIGHLSSFIITKWFQEAFGANLYIEITDDEKFLHKKNKSLEEIEEQAKSDILDIIALGFNPDKTFIFRDTEYIKNTYKLMIKIAKKVTFSTAKAVFGFTGETNIGMIFYPSYQIVPTFFEKKRCLIPAAIDQDPYWRIQRDIAESFGYKKAAAIHSKFIPPLQGFEGKMSSSLPETSIYLADSPDVVKKKINKYAFSGGQPTVEEHKRLGGNPDVDVSFAYLRIFFEEDDKKLREMEESYRNGDLLTGELKAYTIDKINSFLEKHRENRKKAEKLYDKFLYDGELARSMWNKTYS